MFKVLIADDEPLMRKGLTTLIDWQALDCQVIAAAENGQAAKEAFVKYHPQIVISDIKMPVMDGLSLAKWIYESGSGAKVILLTAFADFTYAQQAIQYGVSNYVTKTGIMEEIVSAVEHCKQQLKQSGSSKDDLESRVISLVKSVLDGSLHRGQDILSQAENAGISNGACAVVCAELDGRSMDDAAVLAQVRKVFAELLSTQSYDLIPSGRNQFFILFSNADEKVLYRFCNDSIHLFSSLTRQRLFLGVSRIHPSVTSLPKALEESKLALGRRFYDKNMLHIYVSKEMTSSESHIDFQLVADALKTANLPACTSVLDKMFSLQKQSLAPEETVKKECLMMLSVCMNTAERLGLSPEQLPLDVSTWKNTLENAKFHEECQTLLTELVQIVCTFITDALFGEKNVVAQAQRFIDAHFCEPITLKDVANAIHVNASYLSRYFKQKTGSTVMDTISRKKISFAKQLISEQSLKIYQVAQKVGFDDTTYFSHVFKKYAGISAKAYQDMCQQTEDPVTK